MDIGILGAGKIGRTLALMLNELEGVIDLTLGDVTPLSGGDSPATFVQIDATDPDQLRSFIEAHDAVVSALPYRLNIEIAETCAALGKSYFDFTEDTYTTEHIRKLAETTSLASFVPQCGLAPGMINIVGASLMNEFDAARSVDLRVGALPHSTNNLMRYYLSWSTPGLVNEYCRPCDAIYHGMPVKTIPLEGLEHITIDGVVYEAFNTSGGVATMCETYAGKIETLTYKTMRYPGHLDYMRFMLRDLRLADNPKLLEDLMDAQVPCTDEDRVLLYVNAIGMKDGQLKQKTHFQKIHPTSIHGVECSAIQTSTAAGMAAVIELWMDGRLPPGFVKQESISLDAVLTTAWGGAIYG